MKSFSCLRIASVLLLYGLAVSAADFRVIGYSMNPAPEAIRTHAAQYITDLVYFSVEVNPDGTIDTSNLSEEGLEAVKTLADEHGIRIHLAVGGWGRSEHFAAASNTTESRATFVRGLVELCQKHDFKGIDLDWEFPKSPKEYDAYAELLVETKRAFQPYGLELSAALSPWQKMDASALEALDRVHLMTYDFPKKHSTFSDSTQAVSDFLNQNVPAEKIFMGVPFYGRAIDEHERAITYRELTKQYDLSPETDEIGSFYFNGPTTIARKTRYAQEQKLGGIMIWELGQDTTGELSLLKAIGNARGAESLDDPRVSEVTDVAPAWSGHSVGYCLLTDAPYQYVAYYDQDRQMTVAMRELSGTNWVTKKLPHHVNWDSHHYITMSMDRKGHLHVSGNMHSDPLIYYRTERPNDIDSLERVTSMVGAEESKVTYPQFIHDSDNELLFLYRDGKSGDGRQLVNRYDTDSKNWRRLLPAPLFDGLGKVSCYPEGPVLGPDGYFHLVWVWRVHGGCETNHHLCYARTKDMVNWETAAGKDLPLPITPNHLDTIIDPVPVEGGMINESTVVGFDTEGRVILSYHKFDELGNTQIYNARFEKDEWNIVQTSDWDHRWYFSGGGTIEVDVDLGPVRVSSDGRMVQGYKHVKYGSGLWILDENTLKPISSLPGGKSVLLNHDAPSSSDPNMRVRWKEDENRETVGNHRYFLRWEAPLVTRDQRQDDVADPVMLKVYKIENPETFDPRMSCIHDGYF